MLRVPFVRSAYEIKRGYRSRKQCHHFDDRWATDEAQKEVYLAAKLLMQEHGLNSVVDVGCGSGYKLMHFLREYRTLGIDRGQTVQFLRENHPERTWLDVDRGVDYAALEADLVICSDVIEHVVDPDALMEEIKQINGVNYFVISTPERDLCRGRLHYGPPGNLCHAREWNQREFRAYLSRHVNVLLQQITNVEQGTQMIIGTPKNGGSKEIAWATR